MMLARFVLGLMDGARYGSGWEVLSWFVKSRSHKIRNVIAKTLNPA
ncbi:hypothetical protein AVE30378_03556 [Achromobacter veterisilvae]|uniref:Uncharacterized protein n=1 Tax=Achromobacter veterisilvae TaxID=2069367 RepID=A0A446CNE2_9BURK|nr:hypothetical protein AVE30378_03556 [Achromobacter veterisilvae]